MRENGASIDELGAKPRVKRRSNAKRPQPPRKSEAPCNSKSVQNGCRSVRSGLPRVATRGRPAGRWIVGTRASRAGEEAGSRPASSIRTRIVAGTSGSVNKAGSMKRTHSTTKKQAGKLGKAMAKSLNVGGVDVGKFELDAAIVATSARTFHRKIRRKVVLRSSPSSSSTALNKSASKRAAVMSSRWSMPCVKPASRSPSSSPLRCEPSAGSASCGPRPTRSMRR